MNSLVIHIAMKTCIPTSSVLGFYNMQNEAHFLRSCSDNVFHN